MAACHKTNCNKKPLYLFLVVSMCMYISPQGMINMILGFYLGVESVLVAETKDPPFSIQNFPVLMTYLIGIKNLVYTYNDIKIMLLKEFHPHIVGQMQFMKVKGWGKVFSMFPDLDVYSDVDIHIWGMSLEEYEACRYATTEKVGFHLAKMIVSKASKRKDKTLPSARAHEPPSYLGFIKAPRARKNMEASSMLEECDYLFRGWQVT